MYFATLIDAKKLRKITKSYEKLSKQDNQHVAYNTAFTVPACHRPSCPVECEKWVGDECRWWAKNNCQFGSNESTARHRWQTWPSDIGTHAKAIACVQCPCNGRSSVAFLCDLLRWFECTGTLFQTVCIFPICVVLVWQRVVLEKCWKSICCNREKEHT